MTGAQIVTRALVEEKVQFLFELTGSHTLHIYDALRNVNSIRRITVRYEANAAHMADTVGRLTGQPGVCLVTAGPGATNSLTGVATAFAAASPMVHLSGATPPEEQISVFHGVDDPYFLEKLFKPVTKISTRIDNPAKAPSVISTAFGMSKTGRKGPVHISLPPTFQKKASNIPQYKRVEAKPRRASDKQIRRIINLLRTSRNPLICIGEEAVQLPTSNITTLAEKISAPVISTMEALGVFPQDHPLFAGYLDEFFRQHPIAMRTIEHSDCMLIVGLRPGSPSANFLEQHGPPNVAYLNEEPHSAAKSIRHTANGNVNVNARLLAKSLPSNGQSIRKTWLEDAKHAAQKKVASETSKQRNAIHPGYAMTAMIPFLQKDCIIAVDVGSAEVWARDCVSVWHRCRFLYASQYGGMGFGIPAGIASKLLYPSRQVVSVIGDGGLLMSLGELATIIQHGIDLKIIVLNDSRYGMIWQFQRQQFEGRYVSIDLSKVDFAQIAEGFGVKGVRITNQDRVKQAYEQILTTNGPGLIDIVTSPDVPYLF